MSIQTTNPATNKVLKSFDEMTDEQVEAAIEKSNTFSQTWKKTSYDDRAKVLHKVAELMRQRKDEFAELITLEMGKLVAQAEWEVNLRYI
jgi:succinate-semialdehyde dehydrogenase/glutarate-semialdehyde dehydrogenase